MLLALCLLGALLPDVEVARVQAHLAGAEIILDRRDTTRLTSAQLAARGRARARLAAYREAAVFPENRDFPGRRVPYFVDANGTRCAMAYLIEASGGGALVEEIARTRNHAYVRELVDDPRVVAWLDANGLTAEEAARIQPTYEERCTTPAFCLCGGSSGNLFFPVPTGAIVVEHVAGATTAAIVDARGVGATRASTVAFSPSMATGRYLLTIDATAPGAPLDALRSYGVVDGRIDCDGRPLALDDALAAAAGPRCSAHLEALDPTWVPVCPSGCAAFPASSSAAILALAGLRAWRGRRRARSG